MRSITKFYYHLFKDYYNNETCRGFHTLYSRTTYDVKLADDIWCMRRTNLHTPYFSVF